MTKTKNTLRRGVSLLIISFCTCLCTTSCKEPEKQNITKQKSSLPHSIRSQNGYVATGVVVAQGAEGNGSIVITKDGTVVAKISDAWPISFSPTADILLVVEREADDDTRHYLLNIGTGEFRKRGNRLNYIFGGRYVKEVSWSSDGKTITLHTSPMYSETLQETFDVASLL